MSIPKLIIPIGTIVTVNLNRMAIDFPTPESANEFAYWLQAMDNPDNQGTELIVQAIPKPFIQ